LTEAQVIALEKAKTEKEASGEFESECPGYCAQDTFYVGNMKGVGRIYQQTFIDTYSKVVCAKLYDRKTPITAADLLNDRVVPFFEEKDVKLSRVLTDRGTEYCGNPEHHEYELYWKILIIREPRPRARKRMVSVSVSTRRSSMSSIELRSAKSSTPRSRICRKISMNGSKVTMKAGHIRGVGVSVKHRCKLSLTHPDCEGQNDRCLTTSGNQA
jgi:hypothetical protein